MSSRVIKVLLWFLLTVTINAKDSCRGIETEALSQKVLSSHKNFKFSEKNVYCKAIAKSSKVVVMVSYKSKEKNLNIDEAYLLSIGLLLVDVQTNKIMAKKFLKNFMESDSYHIDALTLETKNFNNINSSVMFSLLIERSGSSAVNPFGQVDLILFKQFKSDLKKVLEISTKSYRGENNGAGRGFMASNTLILVKEDKDKYDTVLKFNANYLYELYDVDRGFSEKWHSKNRLITFYYKDGKYTPSQKTPKPLFNLKQVEKQVKQGLKFKKIVLLAMMEEEYLNKKNLEIYNNIAFYLYKNGHYKESVVILENIVMLFKNRTVAHYNLADAYWALRKQKKAKEQYTIYIKQMKAKGKGKKIPEVVLERMKNKKATKNSSIKSSLLWLDEKKLKDKFFVSFGKSNILYDEEGSGINFSIKDKDKESVILQSFKDGILDIFKLYFIYSKKDKLFHLNKVYYLSFNESCEHDLNAIYEFKNTFFENITLQGFDKNRVHKFLYTSLHKIYVGNNDEIKLEKIKSIELQNQYDEMYKMYKKHSPKFKEYAGYFINTGCDIKYYLNQKYFFEKDIEFSNNISSLFDKADYHKEAVYLLENGKEKKNPKIILERIK